MKAADNCYTLVQNQSVLVHLLIRFEFEDILMILI